MNIERLNPGELLSAIAGLTLLGLMSAVWFEHPTGADIAADAIGYQTVPNAWRSFAVIDIVLLVTLICAVSAAVVTAAGSKIRLPLSASAAVTVFGIVSLLLLAYRIADPIEIAGVTYWRDLPLFLGFAMCALIVFGGLLSMREEGTNLRRELSDAAARRGRSADPAPDITPRREPSRAEPDAGASGAAVAVRRSLLRPWRRRR